MGFLKMSAEIQLIHQIEQFPCLYNYSLPEYNRKDVIDDVWGQIAANINLTVNECREKWRNIRSSFLRSLKIHKSKLKKPYYLAEYLKFVVPFLKPINCLDTEETHPETMIPETGIELGLVKMEAEEFEDNEEVHSECNGLGIINPLTTQRPSRRRRRFIPMAKKNSTDLSVRRKLNIQRECSNSAVDLTSDSPMRMFLMSLLPELETMNEEQIRIFKIKTMMLVDDIKNSQVKRNTNWNNSERLQKRLINLLLKNLQRTM